MNAEDKKKEGSASKKDREVTGIKNKIPKPMEKKIKARYSKKHQKK